MSEFGSMLESTFEHSTPAIFAEVEHIVSDGQSRKTCRLAGLRTDRGEMVAEIIRTSLGPVVVYRSDTGEFNTQDDSYRPWRQDRRRVIGPLTGDPDQTFDLMDKSGALSHQGPRLQYAHFYIPRPCRKT